jgi:hypothetical protein
MINQWVGIMKLPTLAILSQSPELGNERKAADETGIAFDLLPTACPWTKEQVFSDELFSK